MKIESRLDRLEAITDSKRSSAKDVHVDVDDRHAKDIGEVKAKLTLMDNRMVLLESRVCVLSENTNAAVGLSFVDCLFCDKGVLCD